MTCISLPAKVRGHEQATLQPGHGAGIGANDMRVQNKQFGYLAGKNLFNLSDAKVPPATLAALLARHPLFQEVGYLMPNQR